MSKVPRFKRYLYWNYRLSSAAVLWLRRRVTPGGWLVAGGTVATAALGLDTNLAVAYQAFAFLFCLLLAAGVSSRFSRGRFSAQRFLPRWGTTGRPIHYRIAVENRTDRFQRGLGLLEDIPDPRPDLRQFIDMPEPAEHLRNWFDRAYGYYRWRWHVTRNKRAVVEEATLPTLPPKGRAEVSLELLPLRRGVLELRGLIVACPDPFGLFRALVQTALPQSLLILPKRYPLPPIALPGTVKYQQRGVALASAVGESEEFVSLRDYRPGDPVRHIHWRSWAKTGKPIVKEFEDEFFVRHALVLDTFSQGANDDLFEEAVSVAASFACAIQTQESLLDLLFVGPQAYCFTAGRGLAHTEQMLEILASVNPCANKPFLALHQLVIEHSPLVSGCVCVFLAWDDSRKALVQQLKALGVPMLVLVMTTADGASGMDAGPLHDQPERFRPLELGKVAELLMTL